MYKGPITHTAYAARQFSLYWTMTALAGVYSCLVMALMWHILQWLNITYWMDQLYWPMLTIMVFSITTFQTISVTHRRELFPIFYPYFTHAWQRAIKFGWVEEV